MGKCLKRIWCFDVESGMIRAREMSQVLRDLLRNHLRFGLCGPARSLCPGVSVHLSMPGFLQLENGRYQPEDSALRVLEEGCCCCWGAEHSDNSSRVNGYLYFFHNDCVASSFEKQPCFSSHICLPRRNLKPLTSFVHNKHISG